MSDDLTHCPCCEGEGYFYGDEKPPSPWGDAAEIARLRAALADERRHADALAEAAEALDSHAVAIHDADGKCYSVRAKDYARLFDALAQHRARRQLRQLTSV